MKLPFLQSKPQRRAMALQLFSTPGITKSGFLSDGIDLDVYVTVHYSDKTESRPLQVPTIILSADKVREMYAMVTKDLPTTEPKPIRRRARRKFCKNGHLKDAENTILVGGQPRCRTCYVAYNEQEKANRRAVKEAKAERSNA